MKRLALLIPLAALAFAPSCGDTGPSTTDASLATIRRGPLQVTVTESATLYAAQSVNLRSEIEGRAAILWLIPEGEKVEKGDKVAELDVSSIKDREENQAIGVSRAFAAKITAQKNLEIQKNQNASDIESAENEVLFAKLELEKFLGREEMARRQGFSLDDASTTDNSKGTAPPKDVAQAEGTNDIKMGERKQQLVAAIADIEIADEEVKRAENRLKWTVELHNKKYVTDNDLEADQLALKKAKKQSTLARNRLHILSNYTLRKTERELGAKVKEANAELERTRLRCDAKLAQQTAELDSKQQEFDLEDAKLKKYRKQIMAGTLRAPADGLVVYAMVGDRRRREPIDLGTEVREGQTIIKLPDVSTMRIKASINETQVKRVAAGQAVEIRVDALPDEVFFGHVRRVAEVPDSNNSWFSPDKQVYTTHIDIDSDTNLLRDGQGASVIIKVADLESVLSAPIQSLQRAGRVLYLWKETDAGTTAVPVETGLSNDQFVVIENGIAEGDRVWLSRPAGVEEPDFSELNAKLEAAEAKKEAEAKKARTKAATNQPKPGRGNATEGQRRGGDRMAQFRKFMDAAKKRFPADAEALGDMRSLFTNKPLRDKLMNDPELKAQFPELIKRFSGGMRGRRGTGQVPGRRGRESGFRGGRGNDR